MRKKIKVKKFFKGAQADARAGKSPMSPGTSVTGGVRSGPSNNHPFSGNKGPTKTKTQTQTKTNLQANVNNNVKQNLEGGKTFRPIPITPFGITTAALMGLENVRRAKEAKGERLLSRKKTLPATRDFYRQTGRPLNTKIGSPDEQYLKDAGIIGRNKPPPNIGGNNQIVCPVGYVNQNGVCVKVTGKSKGGFTQKYYKGLL
jgi:hypothetical protein|tara:strand:- start:2681 stop:3286 length:606 start_codon:yes stop_codon:yes gene_type:complete